MNKKYYIIYYNASQYQEKKYIRILLITIFKDNKYIKNYKKTSYNFLRFQVKIDQHYQYIRR